MSENDRLFGTPDIPVQVTPKEYEQQVISWLQSAGGEIRSLQVFHQKSVKGTAGQYSLDGWAEFELFSGAKIKILVECKRHGRPVGRDVILAIEEKRREVGAHKAMVFSTSGFQKGALKYASSVGIALVVFLDGKVTYQTNSQHLPKPESYPSDLPEFSGQFLKQVNATQISMSNLTEDYLEPLVSWVNYDLP